MGLKLEMPATQHKQEISCQQVLLENASVFSIQWSIFPAHLLPELAPASLLDRYLRYIRRCTAHIIRPHDTPDGIEFRLLGTSLSLISFLPAVTEGKSLVLRIRGGLLVQPQQCDRGEMQFETEEQPEGVRVSLRLSDYCPLILGGTSPSVVRRLLYKFTQAAIHKLVTIRFLALLYRDLSGQNSTVRVVRAKVRDGRPI